MSEGKAGRRGLCWIVLYSILGVAMAAQLSLLFLLPVGRVGWLVPVAWSLFVLSAVLGWLPVLVFRRRGRVAKGRSYIHTTQLVTTGLYAVVRHPQFVAWDVLALAVMCMTQHWGVFAAGGIGIVANHLTMTKADRDLVEKFGDPYRQYTEQVPRWNLPLGLWRWARRRSNRRFR
jgi:protein-S-isoprenylcysteine O-methyltransferase Ste14